MKIFNKLIEEKLDALWVTNSYNKRYLTNFSGSTCEVVVSQEKIYFITDGRYQTQVKSEVYPGIEVLITSADNSYEDIVNSILQKFKIVGFEACHTSYSEVTDKMETLKDVKFVPTTNFVESMRLIKSEEEINKIKEAVAITDKAFEYICNNIKPGMTEREADIMVSNQQLVYGADSLSFKTILVSGENTAKPHGQATDKIINEGDIVTLDFGCYKNGYVSDMTRTFFVGEPKSEELVKMHNLVLKAHEEQIAVAKAGMSSKELDKVARDIFEEAGYGDKFIHGTGHGIGLEIHEDPYVNNTSDLILEENMLITIEPGIYVEGIGGIRIEEDIVLTKDGCIELNKSYKGYDAVKLGRS